MKDTNPKVDALLSKTKRWQAEFVKLREIALGCGLTEEIKWGNPCYTFEGSNVVLIHGFKDYCALLLFKGSLLRDPDGLLVQQTKNVQAARQIRFTSLQEIIKLKTKIKSYLKNAIEVEKAGLKVDFKKTQEFTVAKEFKSKLDEMPELQKAFQTLTPGRQRAYLLYFSAPKQSKTRTARVEKYVPQIMKGKGLDD